MNEKLIGKDNTTIKKDYKKRGLLWLIIPLPSLILVLFLFGISSYIFGILGTDYQILASVVRIILGLCGLVAIVSLVIGIPLGIINLNKKEGQW